MPIWLGMIRPITPCAQAPKKGRPVHPRINDGGFPGRGSVMGESFPPLVRTSSSLPLLFLFSQIPNNALSASVTSKGQNRSISLQSRSVIYP
jgi:hypothetical protein